ncbi:MAG: T9SS type A sorting domain-containing protein [Bacteroidota bacterium]
MQTPTLTVVGTGSVCPRYQSSPSQAGNTLVSSVSSGNVWYSDVWPGGFAANTASFNAWVPGNYYVKQIAGNFTSLPSNTVTIYSYPMPFATVVPVGPFCLDSPTITLQASPPGGSFAGPGLTGNVFTPAHGNLGATNIILYSYSQTFGNEICSDTAAIRITVSPCTGFTENKKYETGVSIFPNPAFEHFTVFSSAKEILSLRIVDVTGKVVLNQKMYNSQKENIHLGNFPPGIYVVEVQTEAYTTRLRLIKNE